MKQEILQKIEKVKKGEIPEGWTLEPLKNILKLELREVNKPKEAYWRLGLRSHVKGTFHELVENPKTVAMDKLYVVKENDLVVNITFAWEHAIEIAGKKDDGKLVSHRFPTFTFKEGNDPLFFKHLIRTKRFKYDLDVASPGGAGRNRVLNKKEFLEIEVLRPPYEEQKQILEILSTANKIIQFKRKKLNKLIEEKRWFCQNILSGKKRIKEFNSPWKKYKLQELFKFNKGSGLSKKDINVNGKYKCILYGELYTKYPEVVEDVCSRTNTNQGVDSIPEDILIPASTTTNGADLANATVLFEKDVKLGGDINILRKKGIKYDPVFMAYYISNVKRKEISRRAQGITIVHLYSNLIKNMEIEVPIYAEQKKISELMQIVVKEIKLLQKQIGLLKKQKRGLMQLLLTGIIRVKVN